MSDKKLQPFALPTIRTLHKLGKLELTPDYQRESVWTTSQRQLLIDSLIRNFDVPKVYFRQLSKDSAAGEYEVVDGQQRLRAIIDFFDNKYALSDESDDVNGKAIANRTFSELPTDGIIALETAQLDAVILIDYTDEQVREMFARLQNGTSLNAAEKRHAWSASMTAVVRELAKHKAFPEICDFSAARYAYEDMAAKLLHEVLADHIVDIRQPSIKSTYDSNPKINIESKESKQVIRILTFLRSALSKRTVRLKKYSLLSLGILVNVLIDQYNLSQFANEFGQWYEEFEQKRLANKQLEEGDKFRDADMVEFSESARNDSLAALNFRDKILRQSIFAALVELAPLDKNRGFSAEQRLYIYLKGLKKCQICGKDISFEEVHIDHIKPYSAGGKTTVLNAQATCVPCNLSKGAKNLGVSL